MIERCFIFIDIIVYVIVILLSNYCYILRVVFSIIIIIEMFAILLVYFC